MDGAEGERQAGYSSRIDGAQRGQRQRPPLNRGASANMLYDELLLW